MLCLHNIILHYCCGIAYTFQACLGFSVVWLDGRGKRGEKVNTVAGGTNLCTFCVT